MATAKKPPVDTKAVRERDRQQQGLASFLEFVAEEQGDRFLVTEFESRSEVPVPAAPPKDKTNPFGIADIVTFSEHPYYLGLQLYPWQKLALKAFYSGTAGNVALEIDETAPTEGDPCHGCVWGFNKKSEEEQVQIARDGGRPKPSRMLEGNSPCLNCERFSVPDRATRFEHLKGNAINLREASRLQDLEDVPPVDRFQNESDLLGDETLDARVTSQVRAKWGGRFQDLVLVLGRRSGKSMIVAIIALYEAYRLISMPNPQREFGINDFDLIQILNVAVSQEQAQTAIFSKVKAFAASSPFMSRQIGYELSTSIFFLTEADRGERKRREEQGIPTPMHGSIKLTCGHSNSKSLVGGNLWCAIIDEMAAMTGRNEETSTDYELYSQLKPALATFMPHGKMISISNPAGPTGQLYKLYKQAFTDASILMFQLPTWLANPNVEKEFFDSERAKDPTSFPMQYAADFGTATKDAFIPEEYIQAAFDAGACRQRREFGMPGVKYFAHLDPAYSSDYYSLVVGHAEPMGQMDLTGKPVQRLVIDHIHLWKPKGKNHPVNVDEVDRYVIDLSKRFNIVQFSYDHWNSISSIQKLRAFGLNAVHRQFTTKYQSMVFDQMLDLFMSQRIELYDMDTMVENARKEYVPVEDVMQCKDQLLFLQRKFMGTRFKIEAAKGHHDDIPDGIAVVGYEAMSSVSYNQIPRTIRARFGRLI